MEFKLNFKIDKPNFNIFHQDKMLSIGSCFSENIGNKLANSGFDVSINPFGVLFNPISIADVLKSCKEEKKYAIDDLFVSENNFHSLNHHGSFSGQDSSVLLQNLNDRQENLSKTLSGAKTIVITFGSAWVYERIDNGEVVANCHKLSSDIFDKRLLSIDEIVEAYETLIRDFSEDVNFVFTVSPVRHWKDSAIGNTSSKSVLHLAIQELTVQFENVHYFPSYEIVLDELRDYRFFTEDMLHPNNLAVNYVWGKFKETYFSDKTLILIDRVEKFNQLRNHKILNLESDSAKKHINKVESELVELKEVLTYFK